MIADSTAIHQTILTSDRLWCMPYLPLSISSPLSPYAYTNLLLFYFLIHYTEQSMPFARISHPAFNVTLVSHAQSLDFLILQVSKKEYDDCTIYTDNTAVMIVNCSDPRQKKRFTILFEPFQSIPNVPEYTAGGTYYYICKCLSCIIIYVSTFTLPEFMRLHASGILGVAWRVFPPQSSIGKAAVSPFGIISTLFHFIARPWNHFEIPFIGVKWMQQQQGV